MSMAIVTRGNWGGTLLTSATARRLSWRCFWVDELSPKLQQLRDAWILIRPHVDDELKQINEPRQVYVHVQLHSHLLPNGLEAHLPRNAVSHCKRDCA